MSSLVAGRYASALFEVGMEKQLLDVFREQLEQMVGLLKREEKFKALLNSPQITNEDKKQIFREVLGEAVHPYLLNFIYILIDKGRQRHLVDIFTAFQELLYREKNILSARVVSAVPLKEEQLSALKGKLTKQFVKEIMLENKVDPSIMGGLIIYAGDKIIDGSLRNKLEKLKSNLKEIRLQEIGVN